MTEDLTNKIEALLFSAARVITIEEIEEVVGVRDKQSIKNAIKELQEKHKDTSLIILEEKGGYRLTIKEKYMGIVSKVMEETELNKAVMETLAVIAWKAPVLQSDIIKIRTNKAYEHISELKEADFIIKEKSGRSYKIKLAPKFYEYFDIRNKEDIKEKFQEVEKKAEEEQTRRLEEAAKQEEEIVEIEEKKEEAESEEQIIEKNKKEEAKKQEGEQKINIGKEIDNKKESAEENIEDGKGDEKDVQKFNQENKEDIQKKVND